MSHLGTLPVHVYNSEHIVRDVSRRHALAHAVDEEEEVALCCFEHAHLVSFLQLVQICPIVLIDTPTILK